MQGYISVRRSEYGGFSFDFRIVDPFDETPIVGGGRLGGTIAECVRGIIARTHHDDEISIQNYIPTKRFVMPDSVLTEDEFEELKNGLSDFRPGFSYDYKARSKSRVFNTFLKLLPI
jgi:hypothetical protein